MEIRYLGDGKEIVVADELESGYLVSNVVYRDEEEVVSDHIYKVDEIFDSPPTAKYADEVVALSNKIKELKEEHQKVVSDIATAKVVNKVTLAKLKSTKQLENLDDFINRKVTHYVYLSNTPKIVDPHSAGRFGSSSMKLLSLFGDTKGDLSWRVNKFKDGSGAYMDVIPCTSYEQAVDKLREYVNSRCVSGSLRITKELIGALSSHGISIDETYLTRWREAEKAKITRRLDEYRDSVARTSGELEVFDSTYCTT